MILILISTIFLAILFTVTMKFQWLNSVTSVKAAPARAPPAAAAETAATTTKTGTDKEELKGVFATFDKNNDGFITKTELRDSLNNIGIFMDDVDIGEMMEKVDENHDGLIDLKEFCELCNAFLGVGAEAAEETVNRKEKDLREAFEVFDGDTDGLISAEELSKVLGCLGLKQGKTLEDCKEMIRRFDLDGDGMVNFDEFRKMMTQRLIPII